MPAQPDAARRPRAYVRVQGPGAVEYLNRMLSNDVPDEGSADALLLTPKARVIAPLLVWRRGPDDVLLLTEPELGDVVAAHLLRMRFASRCESEREEHVSTVVFDTAVDGIPNRDYARPAVEVLDAGPDPTLDDEELERLRIRAATPRFGRELDERVLPAEAGLEERAISFTKGCYPGQEPVARQHFRGKVNRRLRVLELDGAVEPETGIVWNGKEVGRVTSAVPGLALGYVRVEVPEEAPLDVGGVAARLH
jgi:folate-binding protein YgfZ